ncbi:MAG: hypothetical protein J5629_07310 [Muribaculaceae bacterium]|nr:hypothetical protein [Muribaculaceae bacterium]
MKTQNKNIILIITGKPDPHPTSVIKLMQKNNVEFFRLNTDSILSDYNFSWYCDNNNEELLITNIINNQSICGKQIKSVWLRRPTPPIELRSESLPHINKYNLIEADAFCKALMCYLSDRYSIGSVLHDRYANSKMVQLSLAAKLGITIPNTCITNTKDGVLEVAKETEEVIFKPLGAGAIKCENDMIYEFYAKKVPQDVVLSQPEGVLINTVNFCENYVPKEYEVRATVIGPYVFACKLDSQSQKENEGKIDWRQGYDYGLRHEMISMPKTIENFCKQYLRELHLNFGCFDFVVRPDGEYVFLECNPNGQWGWIEDELGISSISEAMVDCLINCKKV